MTTRTLHREITRQGRRTLPALRRARASRENARSRKARSLAWIAALGLGVPSGAARAAEGMGRFTSMATDGHAGGLFTDNPAIPRIDHAKVEVGMANHARRAKATGSPGTGNEDKLDWDTEMKEQGGGFLLPFGGAAALGATGQFVSHDLTAKSDARNGDFLEHGRYRLYEGRFILGLTDELRFGFAYRNQLVQQDVLGSFNVNGRERTPYKGSLAGYAAGLFWDAKEWGIGLAHVPAMRGKAEIIGEQKILSEPGLAGLDAHMTVAKTLTLGLSAKKWYYKHDDRQELSTTRDTQRSISLYGLDLEQFFRKTQAIAIGADVTVYKELTLRASVERQEGVFLFLDDAVPGDRPNAESAMTYQSAKVALNFQRGGFLMELGFAQSQRSLGGMQDQRGVFGHGRYGDYKATETGGYVALGFTP